MSKKKLDMYIPFPIALGEREVKQTIHAALAFHKSYGFDRFLFYGPSKGFRSKHYPSKEDFRLLAFSFREIKEALAPMGISCGWWIATTVKAGVREDFDMLVRSDGSVHPFMICPLGENYRRAFCEGLSTFMEIGEPDFIFTEDDFQIDTGCFCDNHLQQFSHCAGRYYSRQELWDALNHPEANLPLIKMWRSFSKSTLVGLAKVLREELDKKYPHIPMGYMQTGATDYEGDSTNELVRTLAGSQNIPMTRLFGCFYCGGDPGEWPAILFHPLYSRQHLEKDIKFLHETDTFPHSRYFSSGKDVKTMLATVFSWGFDGSIFHCTNSDHYPGDDSEVNPPSCFAAAFCDEKNRFEEIAEKTENCEILGVEIPYDPLFHTVSLEEGEFTPYWVKPISQFGISYTSKEADIAFMDERFAKYADEETLMKYLSKGLFLDGDAAKALCERGYSGLLGVTVGEDIFAQDLFLFDLGAAEILTPEFEVFKTVGRMPCANMWCPAGQGILRKINIIDKNAHVVTEVRSFQNELVAPGMTYFENSLGGTIVVMGMTLKGNHSQSLFNGQRQKIVTGLISDISDKYVYVENEAKISVIANVPKKEEDYNYLITLINLGFDNAENVKIHIPEKMEDVENIYILDKDGKWKTAEFQRKKNEIILGFPLEFQEPVYLMLR